MECKFVVGQKVVCVPSPIPRKKTNACPNAAYTGEIYTIRGIYIDPRDEGVGVHLNEVVNPCIATVWGWLEPGFYADCFKPLEEKKTDISIFTKMLDPNNKFVEIRKREYAFNDYVVSAYRFGNVDAALRRIKERITRMDGRRH